MATAISTVTKTASVVKTTKGSEKKWSEILSLNRRHDLQLPLEIARYDTESKRTFQIYARQKDQAERTRAHRHETWYHDDFLFRNHLLQQLKPITRRFRHLDPLTFEQNENPKEILEESPMKILSINKGKRNGLPALKTTRENVAFSKIQCPKVLNEFEPRLNSLRHAPFLNLAQRFLQRQPESIEKGIDFNGKQRQQVKILIENEQQRTRLAALNFGQQIQDEIRRETFSDEDKDFSYYK